MNDPDRSGAVPATVDSLWHGWSRLLRSPTASNRSAAARQLIWQLALLLGLGATTVIGLMVLADASVILLMPPRGAPQLWPFRWITDFGKAAYVLWASGLAALAALLITPLLRGRARLAVAGLDVRLAFIFLAVVLADLIGEVLKGAIGRARPFVGGRPDVFQFSPGTWHEPFESLPSAHAITAFALACAVAMAWPRARFAMASYALAVIVSRVALLAHHPSDVVAGALVGIVGALLVRHWFAVRQVGFTIDRRGSVAVQPQPAGVAGGAPAS